MLTAALVKRTFTRAVSDAQKLQLQLRMAATMLPTRSLTRLWGRRITRMPDGRPPLNPSMRKPASRG